jgi:hypothetical protein
VARKSLGSRAALVTNWSVHSASASELVSDLFHRQAADPTISRTEALRQAMVSMIDNGAYSDDSGRALFDYAHPLFWAPYTIVGDGGWAGLNEMSTHDRDISDLRIFVSKANRRTHDTGAGRRLRIG